MVALLAVSGALVNAGVAGARVPPLYKNCAHLNKKYPHGIGRSHARDHATGTRPVTTFRRSDRLYRLAMSYNHGLDRDHDGVACERA